MKRTGLIAFTATFALVACGGSDSPEEQLARTQAALLEAREAVADAGRRVRSVEEEVEAQSRLLEAEQKQLAEAERHLTEVESTVDVRATDQALFRAIQRKLLDQDLSVSAEVSRGVVTLRGVVPDTETAEEVVELARGFPGVTGVTSQLEVAVAVAPEATE